MSILYTAHSKTTAGREGRGETDDKKISVKFSPPGGSGDGTNPEQLFALGYAACFGSAVASVARSQKLDTGEIQVNADVNLHKDDSGYYLSATLNVNLANLDNAQVQAIVEKAHQVCPYSKATRGNIDVKLVANGQAVSAKAA